MNPRLSTLADKIQSLHPDQIAEVEDFVELLRSGSLERSLAQDSAMASDHAFKAVWDNPEDAAYEAL